MRPAFYAVVALVGAVVVTMGVSRLKSALPMVDRSAIQIVTVRRGPVTRKVQRLGVLVPMTTRLQLEKEELTIADEAGRAQLAALQVGGGWKRSAARHGRAGKHFDRQRGNRRWAAARRSGDRLGYVDVEQIRPRVGEVKDAAFPIIIYFGSS